MTGECSWCGAWLQTKNHGDPSIHRYCSDAHKMAMWRWRRRLIAMGIDPETVTIWGAAQLVHPRDLDAQGVGDEP